MNFRFASLLAFGIVLSLFQHSLAQEEKETPVQKPNPAVLANLKKAGEKGADIVGILRPMSNASILTAAEAKALCELIDRSSSTPAAEGEPSAIQVVLVLLQRVYTPEAFDVVRAEGVPKLYPIFDKVINEKGDLAEAISIALMNVFGTYQTEGGALRIIAAAKAKRYEDNHWWITILEHFADGRTGADQVVKELSKPLPDKMLGLALLDLANALSIAGTKIQHPFDSEEGIKKLDSWIVDSDKSDSSFAQSAVAALPFLNSPKRLSLLEKATKLNDPFVRIEAAWAQIMMGDESGVSTLSKMALDFRYSLYAIDYLHELGKEAAIPAPALEPTFAARAELADHLMNFDESGCAPDQVEVLDTRVLYWPPAKKKQSLWVLQYRYEKNGEQPARTGIGLVGNKTAVLPEVKADMKPIEVYSLHCCFELQQAGDPAAPKERSVAAGLEILRKNNPELK